MCCSILKALSSSAVSAASALGLLGYLNFRGPFAPQKGGASVHSFSPPSVELRSRLFCAVRRHRLRCAAVICLQSVGLSSEGAVKLPKHGLALSAAPRAPLSSCPLASNPFSSTPAPVPFATPLCVLLPQLSGVMPRPATALLGPLPTATWLLITLTSSAAPSVLPAPAVSPGALGAPHWCCLWAAPASATPVPRSAPHAPAPASSGAPCRVPLPQLGWLVAHPAAVSLGRSPPRLGYLALWRLCPLLVLPLRLQHYRSSVGYHRAPP